MSFNPDLVAIDHIVPLFKSDGGHLLHEGRKQNYGQTRIVYASKSMVATSVYFFFCRQKSFGSIRIFKHLGGFIDGCVMPDLDQIGLCKILILFTHKSK